MMNVAAGLIAFGVTTVLVFLFLVWYGIKTWSSLILALTVGLIVMFIVTPISSVDEIMQGEPEYGVYVGIVIVVSVLVLFYLVEKVFRDKAEGCGCEEYGDRLIPLN